MASSNRVTSRLLGEMHPRLLSFRVFPAVSSRVSGTFEADALVGHEGLTEQQVPP